ncbi:MotE family protein [Kiloniella sp. b19]|uniref:MotE family protein n=1 Tax=Kiloniella sp. GXU_MW_B19 TaxID=3141326 RepID=UPI0031E28871
MKALPLLIVVGGLSLVVKIGGIWQGMSSIDVAVAQDTLGGFDAGEQLAALGADEAAAQEAGEDLQPAGGENVAAAPSGIVEEEAQDEELPLPTVQGLEIDPFSMTDEELEILQSLSRRREMLVEKERNLDKREVLLQATEKRLDEKLEELQKLQSTIEGLVQKHDEQTEQQMSSLVKIYEAMKPKEAARIFDQLDMVVLLDVIERMKERKTAPILAKMSPDRAKSVTLELAQRRALPLAKE